MVQSDSFVAKIISKASIATIKDNVQDLIALENEGHQLMQQIYQVVQYALQVLQNFVQRCNAAQTAQSQEGQKFWSDFVQALLQNLSYTLLAYGDAKQSLEDNDICEHNYIIL